MKYESHELADLFPMMSDDEILDLSIDIKTNGMKIPIVMHEGKILDGRNRYKACVIAGIDPLEVPFRGKDPLAYVLSTNLQRRHLTTSQRAMVAANIANLKQGEKPDSLIKLSAITQNDAAEKMHVSVASVKKAKAIIAASPEMAKAVSAGKETLHSATTAIKRPVPPPPKKNAMPFPLIVDKNGIEVPVKLIPLWSRREEVQEMIKALQAVKRNVLNAKEKNDRLYAGGDIGRAPMDFNGFDSHIEMAIASLKACYTVHVCPACKGETCKYCCGLGITSEYYFKTIPESLHPKVKG